VAKVKTARSTAILDAKSNQDAAEQKKRRHCPNSHAPENVEGSRMFVQRIQEYLPRVR
jgi:hypothetical protein